MKVDNIKENSELFSVVLSGISVVFAILMFIKIISYFKLSSKAQNIENMVQTIITKDNTRSDDLDKYLGPTKEKANSLKKNNLFAPPQERRNPITEIRCILGDEAFINNKWYKEGDMVQDAKIVTIEPMQVTIEWDEKTTIFRPLDATIASAGPGGRAPSGPGSPPALSPNRINIAPPIQEPPPGGERAEQVMVPNVQLPQGLPPELAERMKGEMENIIPTLQNMSGEEIEEARKEFEAQFSQGMQAGKVSSK